MAEPDQLLTSMESALLAVAPDRASRPWSGVRVLVSAGGTREPIDSVRFIGNRSSGRMGYALAEQAARRGAVVTLVSANVSLPSPSGVEVIEVSTAAELAAACAGAFDNCDVLLMAAAVADFRPRDPAATKLKKAHPATPSRIDLEPTEDVLGALSARRRAGQVLVGFAAEHGRGAIAYGREKLERKGLDAIVINDISDAQIGFDATDNEVTILTRLGGERHVERTGKDHVAQVVLEEVVQLAAAGKERNDRAVRADPVSVARV